MINNPFLIYKLAQNLKQLEGMEIVSNFTTDTSSFNLLLDDGDIQTELEFRVVNNETGLFLKDNFTNHKGSSHPKLNEVKNDLIQNVYQFNNDRIIVFDLIKYKLVYILFGHGKSDVLVTNHHFDVISVLWGNGFKPNDNLKSKLNLYEKNDKNLGLISNSKLVTNEFKSYLKTQNKSTILPFGIYSVLNTYFYHTPFYKSIFIDKYNIDINLPIDNQIEFDDLNTKLEEFTEFILLSEVNYVYNLNNEYFVSNVILKDKKILFETNNIHKSLSFCIYNLLKTDGLNQRKELFLKPLKRVLSKNEGLLKEFKFGINLEELANNYKTYADVLISQSNPKLKSGKKIDLLDFEGNKITIPLDEKLNLIDNATKYYNKSNKTKKDYLRRLEEIPILENKVIKIKEILDNLISINDNKTLKTFEQNLIMSKEINVKDLKINLNQLTEIANDKFKNELKFRKFDLSEGYTLYLGKDASNNDELTMKFGKSNDVWLHAKGVSGSHGIIKNNSSKYPPKHIIEEAAEICAYYSQSRNAKYVPVIYTFKKNVTKPKGAAKGAVRVNKEEVILVSPKSGTNEK